MSELKEHLFVPYSELREGDELTDAFTIAKSYYLKSEADKVIAKLKARIAELEEECRWRKCSESLPRAKQRVLFLAKYKTDNIRTWIGEFRNVGFDVFLRKRSRLWM